MSKLLKWLSRYSPDIPIVVTYDDISKASIQNIIELPWQTNILSVDNGAYDWLKSNYENHFDWAVGGRYIDAGIHGGFFGKTVVRTHQKGMAITVYTLKRPFEDKRWVQSFHDYYGFTMEQYAEKKLEAESKRTNDDRDRETVMFYLNLLKPDT